MLTIGIDPDLHDLAIGFWQNGQPHSATVLSIGDKLKQHTAVLSMCGQLRGALDGVIVTPHAVAVEAQTLQRTGPKQHKRPQDIVVLGNVAGAALMMCVSKFGFRSNVFFPTPEEWKGQIPKAVMQARMYEDLGWGYEMCAKSSYAIPQRIPAGFRHLLKGQWKHVGDAILLARWAAEQSA